MKKYILLLFFFLVFLTLAPQPVHADQQSTIRLTHSSYVNGVFSGEFEQDGVPIAGLPLSNYCILLLAGANGGSPIQGSPYCGVLTSDHSFSITANLNFYYVRRIAVYADSFSDGEYNGYWFSQYLPEFDGNYPPKPKVDIIDTHPTLNEGDSYSGEGSFQDTESLSWTATVDYGDGSGTQNLSLNPDKTFSLSHLYADEEVYTVTVSITNNNDRTGVATEAVRVTDGQPTTMVPYFQDNFTASDGTILCDYNSRYSTRHNEQPGSECITTDTIINNTLKPSSSNPFYFVDYFAIPQHRDVCVSFDAFFPIDGESSAYGLFGRFDITLPPSEMGNFSNATSNSDGTEYQLPGVPNDIIFLPRVLGWHHLKHCDIGDYHSFSLDGNVLIEGLDYRFRSIYAKGFGFALINGDILGSNNPEPMAIDNLKIEVGGTVNTPPTVDTLSATPNPVTVNTSVTTSADFTDTDTHTAIWNWGDGTTNSGIVTESNGSGSVSGNHTYTTAGVYEVTLTVTDNQNASASSTFQYISVYNPTPQGLFSGVRIFTSPVGAYTANPSLTGQVQFGITAKYSGTTPTGNVKLDFKQADFDFESDSITTLVTVGGNATLRGTGSVNGTGGYTFLVTGFDGHDTNTDDAVRFQIKNAGGSMVYDTQLNASDTASPTTSVTGQIVVH